MENAEGLVVRHRPFKYMTLWSVVNQKIVKHRKALIRKHHDKTMNKLKYVSEHLLCAVHVHCTHYFRSNTQVAVREDSGAQEG